MSRSLALAASLLLASGAVAQTMELTLQASQTTVTQDDPTITIDVWASWDGDPVGFAAAVFDTLGVQNWASGLVTDYPGDDLLFKFYDIGNCSDCGELMADNDIIGSAPSQLPPFFHQDFVYDEPVRIFSVEWETTDFTPREVCVEVVPSEGYVYLDDFGTTMSMSVIGDSLCFDVGSGNCPGDFNGDGRKDTRDVLDFLNAWSAGDRRADWNGDGNVDTRDVLGFLNDWIIPC